jgi:hypothetical protein
MRTKRNKKIFDQTWIISIFKTSTEALVDDEVLEGFYFEISIFSLEAFTKRTYDVYQCEGVLWTHKCDVWV